MGKTKIEWTEESWNPFRGVKGKWHCTKVSDGCKNCYAERLNLRFAGIPYTVGADTIVLDQKILQQPLHWRKPRMVFAPTMTDPFHETVSSVAIRMFFITMATAGRHTFQVLTKRPARGRDLLSQWYDHGYFYECPIPNIWLGVSVEDQKTADERIPILLDTPAAVRFVSYEPALGPVDFNAVREGALSGTATESAHDCNGDPDECYRRCPVPVPVQVPRIDQIIFGGESGPRKRPVDLQWARDVRDQCKAAGVAFFMKQVDKVQPIPDDLMIREFPHA